MAIALRMARRGLGTTAPNPAVGAVIADERTGEVIARGWTQPGGRPHAETEALARAGSRARGMTIYVTLEPCSHHGRTAPCADAILAAGVARVVVGIEDPDPRVSGRGLRRLRDAGLSVTRSVMAPQARLVTRGHVVRVTERRPFVQLKMALDASGAVARGQEGQPVWVTGPQARAHGHLLRAQADAIVVGAGTMRDDDPELTCRLPGLEAISPLRVVIAGQSLPDPSSRLVRTAQTVPVLIFAAPNSDADRLRSLEAAGCRVIIPATVGGRLWLPSIMEALVAEGVTRILVEGGPSLWRDFMSARLVDEIVQFRALGSGRDAASLIDAANRAKDETGTTFPLDGVTLADARRLGDDAMIVLQID